MTYIRVIDKGFAVVSSGGVELSQFGIIESVVSGGFGIYDVVLSEALEPEVAIIHVGARNTLPLNTSVVMHTQTTLEVRIASNLPAGTISPFEIRIGKVDAG